MSKPALCAASNGATLLAVAAGLLFGTAQRIAHADPHGNQYRLLSGGMASVTAHASSANSQLYVVGGSGQPVGESSSTNISGSGGGGDNSGPTERIFHGTFDG